MFEKLLMKTRLMMINEAAIYFIFTHVLVCVLRRIILNFCMRNLTCKVIKIYTKNSDKTVL